MAKTAIVIGAGIGGLSTAIRLAASGWQVQIYEQNDSIGGKMGQVEADGFRWDTGPSVITMRHVLDDLFASAGRKLDDYLTLKPVEPLTRYFYPDGVVLDASRDLAKMASQIEALNERDVEGYLSYLAYAARIHRITGPVFIYNKPPKLWDILSVPPLEMPHVDPMRTMSGAINSFVEHPHLRQLLGRFATYTGASPYQAPATLNVIAHVELTGGVWYPQGGIYAIASALGRLATELGVQIHTGCPVTSVQVKDEQTTGITLTDGRTVTADAVIANLDVALVYEKLLSNSVSKASRLRELTSLEPSCSGYIMLLGIDKTHDDLAHHNIFFSPDYPAEFRDIFERGVPPEDPTIYVSITSKADSDHAPDGCENWFILVNAPPVGEGFEWTSGESDYRQLVLDKLAEYGYDVRDHIISERTLTPIDLERLTGARRGALYGASSNSKWTAFRRPHNRAPDVNGLYFTGGTTHPGGGVPMVMLSGASTANMILEDYS
ncbi:MAG: phytoene desaturase family protein [Chloroflexota bacterium]